MAFGAKARQQIGGFFKCGSERAKIRDLTANVNVNRAWFKTGQPSRMSVSCLGIFPGNTEFVFGLAGGNLFMRARIDIGIDPECHLGGFAQPACDCGKLVKLARLSTLNCRIPASSPAAISSSVLPTPENTIFSGSMPAAKARCNSPKETISAPAPRRASVAITRYLNWL